MAPEIIKGSKVGYGKSVDIWALGILLFEMLSGYPPFYDNEPIGIYKKIIAGIIEFPRFFELKVKDILRKLLNPEAPLRLGVKDVFYLYFSKGTLFYYINGLAELILKW